MQSVENFFISIFNAVADQPMASNTNCCDKIAVYVFYLIMFTKSELEA